MFAILSICRDCNKAVKISLKFIENFLQLDLKSMSKISFCKNCNEISINAHSANFIKRCFGIHGEIFVNNYNKAVKVYI